MAKQKRIEEKFVTPRGALRFVKVFEPDRPSWEPEGVFQAQVILPLEEAQPIIDLGERLFAEYVEREEIDLENDGIIKVGKKKKPGPVEINYPWEPEYELDDDNKPTDVETGNTIFRTRQKAIIRNKDKTKSWPARIKVLAADAKTVITEDPNIGAGSEGRLAGLMYPWGIIASDGSAGISMRLEAVQLIQLVEWTGSGGNHEFAAEEGFMPTEADDEDDAGDNPEFG
jgi:hypothetical protein